MNKLHVITLTLYYYTFTSKHMLPFGFAEPYCSTGVKRILINNTIISSPISAPVGCIILRDAGLYYVPVRATVIQPHCPRDNTFILPCKAKRQYLLTCKVSRYSLFITQIRQNAQAIFVDFWKHYFIFIEHLSWTYCIGWTIWHVVNV